jgi:hypothetical protein
VKRKVPASSVPPRELTEFDPDRWAPPGSDGDPRRATRAHDARCASRAAWVAVGNAWPSGEDHRELEEAMSTPDEPWDVSDATNLALK